MPRSLPSSRRIGVAAAALLCTAALVEALFEQLPDASRAADAGRPLGVLLAVLATAPLALIWRWPRIVVSTIAVTLFAATALGFGAGGAGVALLIAVALAATRLSLAAAVPLALAAATAMVIGPRLSGDAPPVANAMSNASLVALSGVLGAGARLYQRYASALEERTRELQLLRDAETREAVTRERLRIARDVHDVVGHALAAITLHARVAGRRLARDPEGTARALGEIAELASGALAETREAVGQMRTDDANPDRAPQPSLADIDDLVAHLRASDLSVALCRRGDTRRPVPALVQAAAFRIVQESLSNVARHARPAKATVLVEQRADAVHIEVCNDGNGSADQALAGNGIVGMRERAAGVGGALEVGPVPGGRWRVSATLPLGGAT